MICAYGATDAGGTRLAEKDTAFDVSAGGDCCGDAAMGARSPSVDGKVLGAPAPAGATTGAGDVKVKGSDGSGAKEV